MPPERRGCGRKNGADIPPEEFFNGIDGKLVPILRNMPDKVYGCDKEAGRITAEWADKLGLSRDVLIGIGNIDSHSGAVGAGITLGTMAMNLGTSACFMAITPRILMSSRGYSGKWTDQSFRK